MVPVVVPAARVPSRSLSPHRSSPFRRRCHSAGTRIRSCARPTPLPPRVARPCVRDCELPCGGNRETAGPDSQRQHRPAATLGGSFALADAQRRSAERRHRRERPRERCASPPAAPHQFARDGARVPRPAREGLERERRGRDRSWLRAPASGRSRARHRHRASAARKFPSRPNPSDRRNLLHPENAKEDERGQFAIPHPRKNRSAHYRPRWWERAEPPPARPRDGREPWRDGARPARALPWRARGIRCAAA